jgi:hypothetical protein
LVSFFPSPERGAPSLRLPGALWKRPCASGRGSRPSQTARRTGHPRINLRDVEIKNADTENTSSRKRSRFPPFEKRKGWGNLSCRDIGTKGRATRPSCLSASECNRLIARTDRGARWARWFPPFKKRKGWGNLSRRDIGTERVGRQPLNCPTQAKTGLEWATRRLRIRRKIA